MRLGRIIADCATYRPSTLTVDPSSLSRPEVMVAFRSTPLKVHCTAVVVSLGILPYIQYSWIQFVREFHFRCWRFLWTVERRMGRSMADGTAFPRVITSGLLHCGQTHSEPTRGSLRN